MKKYIAVLLCALLILSLCACSGNADASGAKEGVKEFMRAVKAGDDGLARVAVYIQHRGKVQINAKAAQLARGDLRCDARAHRIARCGDSHIARRDDGVRAQARYHAALLIDSNEGGMAGFGLNQLLDIGAQGTKLGIIHHIVTK